jgi:hypothetical protein
LRAACAARNTGGVHKNIGFDKSIGAASMRRREPNLPAPSLPSHVGERSFGGLAGCPNAAQPERQIVSTPLLGLAVGDGKGARGGCPRPAPREVSLG